MTIKKFLTLITQATFSRFAIYLVFLFVISITVSGCLQVNTGKKKQAVIPDGGFLVSNNKGASWERRTSILSTTGDRKNFSLSSVSTIALDPNDPNTIYYGTINQGMLYTYDRGKSWQVAKKLGQGTVESIAVDPGNTCTIYVAIGGKVFKTEDCNRSWKTIFLENSASVEVTAVAVDHFNSNNIYATLSRGDIVKSVNGGKSWQTIYRFGKKIKRFYIDPNDSRRIYAVVDGEGLQRSDDSANSWQKMDDIFSEFKIGTAIVDFKLFKGYSNLMIIATKQGIIKSKDRGLTWEQLPLLPPKADASISAVAINPADNNEVYYVAGSVFYKSIDSGKNWEPSSLPTTKKAEILLLDHEKDNILYVGLKN